MTDDRDDLDQTLAAGLADLAPAEPDAAQTLAALRPRMQQARTRHRVLQGSAVAAVIVVFGVGVALASPPSKRAEVQVTNPPATESTLDSSRGTSTTVPAATTVPAVTTVPAATTLPGATRVPGATPAVGPPPTNAMPGVTSPSRSTPSTATPSTAVPDAGTNHTYTSAGGTVTVLFRSGRLSLVSYKAASGYTPEVHTNNADEIEVRFGNDVDDTRVRVRVKDGRLEPEIRND